MRQRRRVLPGRARAAFALGCAGALIGVAVAPAQAAEVSFATHCIPPVGDPVDGTTKVEITAPATAKVGDEVEVVWKFVQAASKNPGPIVIEKDKVKPTGTLKAAGAQTADIPMEGPQENPEIPIGSDMVLSDMKGTLKLTTAGDVTLTPDAFVVNAYGTKTNCAPTQAVQAAATIKVEEGDGSSPSPTPSPTESGSTSPTPTESATESPSETPSASPSETDGGQTDFTGEVVDIPYTCESPIGTQKASSTIQINAKKDGANFDLTVQFKKSPMNSPAPIPAGKLQPFMDVVLGGADEGSVAVEGPVNAEEIKTGDPIEIPDMTGTYKPGATGESTLSPGVLTIKALGTTTTCTPDKTSVSLTLDTTEQEGGASGGTSGGDTSSGGLAATGSEDHDALKALGLVAGTAVLLGAGVFTFMPGRRRLR